MKKFLKCIILTSLFCSLLTSCTDSCSNNQSSKLILASKYAESTTSLSLNNTAISGEKAYIGILGDSAIIHMSLIFDGSDVSGTYYHFTENDKKYSITGKINNSKLTFQQSDSNGSVNWTFEGFIINNTKIFGLWSSPDKVSTLQFEAFENTSNDIGNNLSGNWTRIDNNNADLKIYNTGDGQLNFDINAQNGVQSGSLSGTILLEDNIGYYKSDTGNNKLYLALIDDTLTVITCDEAGKYEVSGVVFDGKYKKVTP